MCSIFPSGPLSQTSLRMYTINHIPTNKKSWFSCNTLRYRLQGKQKNHAPGVNQSSQVGAHPHQGRARGIAANSRDRTVLPALRDVTSEFVECSRSAHYLGPRWSILR